MKKLFVLLLIFISGSMSYAQERIIAKLEPKSNYLILLEKPASSIITTDETIADAEVLATIFNEKNQVILTTAKEGSAKLYIDCGDDVAVLELDVNEANILADVTASKTVQSIMKIDLPFGSEKKKIPNQKTGTVE